MYDIEKLEKLGFDFISFKVSGDREMMYVNNEIKNWIDNQEGEDKYIVNIFIDILAINLESEDEIKIGKIFGNYFEKEEKMLDTTFYNICNAESTELEHMASAIVDKNGNVLKNICNIDKNIMYIDRIYIEQNYRNLGIASYVLEALNEILNYSVNLNPDILILLPMPQEKDKNGLLGEMKDEEEKKINKEKLLKLYKKIGFKKIKNTDYMMKNKW